MGKQSVLIAVFLALVGLGGCSSGGSSVVFVPVTPTPSPPPTASPTPTAAPTATATSTGTPSATPTPTGTPIPTGTPTSTPSATPTPVSLTSTSSTLVAIDCTRNVGYVGRALPSAVTGDGLVEVLDLSVNPNVTNPHKANIDLGSPAIPTSLAWDPNDSLIIVVAQHSGVDGSLYLIDETTNTLVSGSPFAFPAGSNSGPTGGVVFDPIHDQAIAATCDNSNIACLMSTGDPLTGFVTFDIASHKFSAIVTGSPPLPPTDNLSFNFNSEVLIAPSDVLDASTKALEALNTANSAPCTLTDANVSMLGDANASAFDPATNLLVVGDSQNFDVAVVNLNGAAFTGSTPPCFLNEGGTPPNSVFLTTEANFSGISANPATHQAFLDDDTSELLLLTMPSAPLTQIKSSDVTAQAGAVPTSPTGVEFFFQTFPYANTLDVCHNLGYVRGVDTSLDYQFLVQVDLGAFAKDPAGLSTPLTAGTCAGVTPPTATSCSNGTGVVYFPLAPSLSGAPTARKNARQRSLQ
jgi:hypothetical protein